MAAAGVRVVRVRARDFRSHASADVALSPGLTVVHGPNGAGKTNLLDALYFGCTARSCRTTDERQLVRFGAPVTRVELDLDGGPVARLAVGFQPGEAKRITADDQAVERFAELPGRPLAAVFLPDRLELVKGAPALRRAHLDQVVAALHPARSATRKAYGQALAQRNALLARIRAGRASRAGLGAWDAELARHAIALMDDRREAVEAVREPFAARAGELGLAGDAQVEYRPRSRAASPAELAHELATRVAADLERGFTAHGPHRDDLRLERDGRELRAYGSQGEQRVALLALLLAERDVLARARGSAPLLLLDDVMSELDAGRRERLADELVHASAGQSLVTTTDLTHVPGADAHGVARIRLDASGAVLDAGTGG